MGTPKGHETCVYLLLLVCYLTGASATCRKRCRPDVKGLVNRGCGSRFECKSDGSGADRCYMLGYDCYYYTEDDLNQNMPEKNMCERYKFHVYTAANNQAYKGCGRCYCCQWKGCYDEFPRNYNGTWGITKTGRRCQRWDSQSPHEHTLNEPDEFPRDASVSDARFYCRDPGDKGGLWCFTEDPSIKWEYCDIPKC